MPFDLDNLDDAEKFQQHFVTPLVDKVAASVAVQIAPLVAQHDAVMKAQADHETRLASLEANQKKALMGYAGVVAVVTGAWHYVKAKYLSKFFT